MKYRRISDKSERTAYEQRQLKRQNVRDLEHNPKRLTARIKADLEEISQAEGRPWQGLIGKVELKKRLVVGEVSADAAFAVGGDNKGILRIGLPTLSLSAAKYERTLSFGFTSHRIRSFPP